MAVGRNFCGRCWREDHEEMALRSIFGGRAREWGAASGKRDIAAEWYDFDLFEGAAAFRKNQKNPERNPFNRAPLRGP